MRNGTNPNRQARLSNFPQVVCLVITHLPNLVGYHSERMDVIHHSLWTLTDHCHMDIRLMIWDNGSCRELQEWLIKFTDSYLLPRDTLILSPNIGKTNALKAAMRSMPAGTILAYGDDDIEYFPDWLAPQLEILKTFPNVGVVSGYPTRLQGGWGTESTKAWARKNADIRVGRFIPDEWEKDYCISTGADWISHKNRTANDLDTLITYHDTRAYVLAHHCQFVCFPERIEPLMEWTQEIMPAEHPFDLALDKAGLLRLCTVKRVTRHIGNVLEVQKTQ